MRSRWKPLPFRSASDTASRSATIRLEDVGKRVLIRSGNRTGWVQVRSSMVGLKFGAFLRTKRLGREIHQKAQTKKRKHGSRS